MYTFKKYYLTATCVTFKIHYFILFYNTLYDKTQLANSRRDKIEKNRHSMKVSCAGFQRRGREYGAK